MSANPVSSVLSAQQAAQLLDVFHKAQAQITSLLSFSGLSQQDSSAFAQKFATRDPQQAVAQLQAALTALNFSPEQITTILNSLTAKAKDPQGLLASIQGLTSGSLLTNKLF